MTYCVVARSLPLGLKARAIVDLGGGSALQYSDVQHLSDSSSTQLSILFFTLLPLVVPVLVDAPIKSLSANVLFTLICMGVEAIYARTKDQNCL